jgi:glyoxylate reductase
MPKTILITSNLVRESGINLLHGAGYTIDQNTTNRLFTYDELKARVQSADAVLSSIGDKIDAPLIDAATTVKIFANFGVGFNNIDWHYAKSKNIFATNTPDALTNATADTAFLLLLAVARRYRESERLMRDGSSFIGWATLRNLGVDLHGKTLGIVGFGRIGEAVAARAKAFGMTIIFTSRSEKKSSLGSQVDFETLLAQSDVISIHTPLTDATKHSFAKREFDKMKPDAILINTARGAVINESDLVQALRDGKFFGVGLDVYEFEPKVTESLYDFERAVLLPHIGGASIQTRNRMSVMCAENIIAALNGKTPPNVVW